MTEVVRHAHGGNHFGVLECAANLASYIVIELVGFLQFLAGGLLVGYCQYDHENSRDDSGDAKPGVEQEHHSDINRKPGRIEKRK